MTICIAGKNKIAIEALDFFLKQYPQYDYIACLNKTDLGINTWQPSFRAFCEAKQIASIPLTELYAIKNLLFISLEYDRLIDPEKFYDSRLVNIHFSKLPAYKGMFTSVFPLLFGESESAVTLHLIDKGIDTGKIIDQMIFPLTLQTTAADLYKLYLHHSFNLLKKNIDSLLKNSYSVIPQPEVDSSYFSKESIDFSNIKIDLRKTAFEIHNQIRAFTFREYQLPEIRNYKIYKSKISKIRSIKKAGSELYQDDSKLILSTIDYDIELYKDRMEELCNAAKEGSIERFEQIKKSGFPIALKTKEGWDVFIVACYYNQYNLVNYLLNCGWDVNMKNYKGTTALMYSMTAVIEGKGIDVFKSLLPKADLQASDDKKCDLFYYATKYGNSEVLDLLQKQKSNS